MMMMTGISTLRLVILLLLFGSLPAASSSPASGLASLIEPWGVNGLRIRISANGSAIVRGLPGARPAATTKHPEQYGR